MVLLASARRGAEGVWLSLLVGAALSPASAAISLDAEEPRCVAGRMVRRTHAPIWALPPPADAHKR
jgi:hypothetical protein